MPAQGDLRQYYPRLRSGVARAGGVALAAGGAVAPDQLKVAIDWRGAALRAAIVCIATLRMQKIADHHRDSPVRLCANRAWNHEAART
jgi:hypothetical protein